MTKKTAARGHKLTEEQKQSLYADAKAGMKLIELAKKYEVSTATANFHRRRALGIAPPPSAAPKSNKVTKATKARLAAVGAPAANGHEKAPVAYGPEALGQINADIAAGMSEKEIKAKYQLGPVGIKRLRARMETPTPSLRTHGNWKRGESAAPAEMDQSSVQRMVGIMQRLAQRHPAVFAEINPLAKLAKKYPNILMEVL